MRWFFGAVFDGIASITTLIMIAVAGPGLVGSQRTAEPTTTKPSTVKAAKLPTTSQITPNALSEGRPSLSLSDLPDTIPAQADQGRYTDRTIPPAGTEKYYRPTCTPSRAQLIWARMLPGYPELRRRYKDSDIIAYFGNAEVKSLTGDLLPEHLVPKPMPKGRLCPTCRAADGSCRVGAR